MPDDLLVELLLDQLHKMHIKSLDILKWIRSTFPPHNSPLCHCWRVDLVAGQLGKPGFPVFFTRFQLSVSQWSKNKFPIKSHVDQASGKSPKRKQNYCSWVKTVKRWNVNTFLRDMKFGWTGAKWPDGLNHWSLGLRRSSSSVLARLSLVRYPYLHLTGMRKRRNSS